MGKGGSERKQKKVNVMSEDAPVNVGASGWPSDARAYLGVRRMQTKLHGWAATDGGAGSMTCGTLCVIRRS